MEAPRFKEYVTDAVVVDCRNGLPADEYFDNLDIEGKALVLYTGNMATKDVYKRQIPDRVPFPAVQEQGKPAGS